ncbi:DNA internalization-related competence protein ComEC/Rec2 [Thermoactinomyces sp. DSM 45892]|uniref:DNA internalization-related competence protein ComEC/Rec2 n=1 Tax=Thermoactinomyces sp. DSM 45892 TaxID=1882753 RepID=UPI00089C9E40|nr:DNA internalization-related competence protein ComEC/Rec2 [Thermoactinomyces sp. DSM 45892]SDZ24663.1 competence protein ComEC [Thermoactinomyces sp. DSM 45892]
MNRPLVKVAIGWLMGVLCVEFTGSQWLLYTCGFIAVLVSRVLFITSKVGRSYLLIALTCTVSGFVYSFTMLQNVSKLPIPLDEDIHVIGTIESKPIRDGDQLRFDLKLSQIRHQSQWFYTKERIRVVIKIASFEQWKQSKQVRRGWVIQSPLQMERPPLPRNPGAFHYRYYLQQQSIFWIGKATGLHNLKQIGIESSLMTWIDQAHQWFSDQIEHLYADTEVQGFMKGLLLGDRYDVPMEWEAQYQALGLVHILSISGFHVSLLVAAIFWMLRYVGITREKSAWLILSLLPFYVLLTGAEPPIVRAGIVSGMMCLAIAWRKEKDILSFLCLAGMMQLCFEPLLIFNPGFQLSYVVTAALIVGTTPLAERFPYGYEWLRYTVAGASVAQAASFPLLVYYFHESSLFSLMANVLFAPFFSVVVLPIGYGGLLVSFLVFSVGVWLAQGLTWMVQVSQSGIEWLQQVGGHLFSFAHPNWIWLLVYILLMVGSWWTWVSVRYLYSKIPWMISGVWVCWIGVGVYGNVWPASYHEITMIDVGQGDAFFIRTKSGKSILIDGGGRLSYPQKEWQERRDPFDVGEDVVVPFLTYQGVNQIDLLVSTHGDADHLQGLGAVVRRFSVEKVIRNPLPTISKLERDWIREVRARDIPIHMVPMGQVWEIEPGFSITFLYPDLRDEELYEGTSNNAGLVLLFTIDQKHILFTGDIEKHAEEKLLQSWNLPKIDIYKVAHHGSKTSSTEAFIHQIRPRYALVSTGEKNLYGHPSPEVIGRLQKAGTKIYRTDQMGAVTIRINQEEVRFSSMLQEKGRE